MRQFTGFECLSMVNVGTQLGHMRWMSCNIVINMKRGCGILLGDSKDEGAEVREFRGISRSV